MKIKTPRQKEVVKAFMLLKSVTLTAKELKTSKQNVSEILKKCEVDVKKQKGIK